MRRGRGLTLIELSIGLAILALLAAIAVPAFGERIARARLAGAAETLAADLAEARFESAQSGRPLYVVFSAGAPWCYAVARTPGCDCHGAPPCALKVAHAGDTPGVELVTSADAAFDPGTGEVSAGGATLRGVGGRQQLQVSMTPLGRARLCSPSGLKGYPAC
ncbi:MAG: hypothetical protein Fur0014_05380 [Rubrivivax sp.]